MNLKLSIFIVIFFLAFANFSFGQVVDDTCPGGDATNEYTCAVSDNTTCTDVRNRTEYQTVACFPANDYYGPVDDFCNENRSDSCGNGKDDQYTCLPNEYRSCFDIVDRDNGNNCGSWAFSFESEGRDIICYPDSDVYGGFQGVPCSITDQACRDIPDVACISGFCGYIPQSSRVDAAGNSCDLREWTAAYKPQSGGAAYGYSTTVDLAGNIYVTGEAFNAVSANSGLDMFVAKFTPNGSLDFSFGTRGVVKYNNNGNESGYGVAVDNSGVYVTGRVDSYMMIAKYDLQGTDPPIWRKIVPANTVGRGIALAGGRVYVVGATSLISNEIDSVLLSYDVDGNNPISTTSNISGNDSAYAVAVFGSDIYITGYQSTNSGDMFLVKYDTAGNLVNSFGSGGAVIYDSLFDNFNANFTTAAQSTCIGYNTGLIYEKGIMPFNFQHSFQDSNIARIYIAGWGEQSEGWFENCAGANYDRTIDGKRLFYEFNWDDILPEAQSVTVSIIDHDGSTILGSETFYRSTPGGVVNCDGAEVFCSGGASNISVTRSQELPCNNSPSGACTNENAQWPKLSLRVSWDIDLSGAPTDIGRGITISQDGSTVFVTGYQSTKTFGGDMFLNAYQVTDGAPKWSETYNSGDQNNDVGRAVVADRAGAGRVYVAGSQGTNSDDVFLQEYFSSDYKGFLQNTLISDLPYQDIAYGIAIGPASESEPVYVSGYRASNGGEAFLNKYSCNAPTGAGATSNGYFTVSPANIYTGTEVRVDATQSGPGISKYEWNWDYINNPSGFSEGKVRDEYIYAYDLSAVYPINRTIALGITYTDARLQPATITQPIIVYENHQPTAAFTITPSSGQAPLVVTVNGAGSDPDGSDTDPGDYIKDFIWDWGDGTPNGQGQQTTHLYSRPTSTPYIITLIVEDSVGASNSFSAPFTQTVTVTEQYVCSPSCGADEPVCGPTGGDVNASNGYFTVSPSARGLAPFTISVDAALAGPDITDYEWDWNYDGETFVSEAVGVINSHSYNSPGIYTMALKITGGQFNGRIVAQIITVDGSATQCYQCLSNTDCGSGYRCLGISCKQGQMCSDGVTECPADGRCPEATSCKAGDVCLDGSACLADGICYSQDNKNTCVLSSDTQAARCYTEGVSAGCATDLDCTASLQGGTCDTGTGECRYARCLNETSFTCESDKNCNDSDGICYNGQCDYIYDCAYGPGMGDAAGIYTSSSAKPVPAMPIGIQPDGEACTKPTPDAPNNCEGINGCLYYNYNGNGTTVTGDANNPIGSSVANCLNKFEGGTGCVYYGDQADAVNSRVNCLPGTDFGKLKSKTAPPGIPAGCVVMDKGSGKKEYDCTGVNNCYYYLNGVVDCDYMGGAGCIYEPNPAGAAFCPRAFKTPTGGINYVQCLLNPDAVLPSFLLGSGGDGLLTCSTGADCPAGAPVCINGTCYPACQGDVDCVTGGQCIDTSCDPVTDPCTGELLCINNICVDPDPSSFSCYDTTAVHKLDYGVRSTNIAVRSSQNASCRWSLFDVPFDQMISPIGFSLDTNNLVNHTTSAVGFPSAGTSTIFIECENSAGAVDSCNVPLTLSDPCDSDADCRGDLVCIDGWCRAPVCDNAQPQGSLPYSALSDGTPISMTTTVDSNCVYSDTYANTNQCVAPILSCSTAVSFATTGGTAHSSFLPGSSLVIGNNYQYVKCQETNPPQSLSRTCTIPANVLTCNPYAVTNECDNDWVCAGIGSGPGICIPPDCSGAKPTGTLPYTADNADIGMTTGVPATCAYSDNFSDSYDDMTAFTETGDLAHLSNISVERNSDVYRYAICNETATDEKTDVCTIRFKVGDLLPICGGAYPRGRQDVNVELPIGLNTNQSAVCKFADAYDNLVALEERYDNMVNTFRRTVDGLMHGRDGVLQDAVVVVQGDNTKYVACREDAAPNKITECRIPFSGRQGPCTGALGECEFGSVCDPQTDECVPPCESSDPPEWCWDPPRPNCNTMPWLPQCIPGENFCAMNPDAPECQTSCNTLGYAFFNQAVRPSGNCSLVAIIMALLSWLAWIVALLAVLSGLRAAYLYITSAGDEKKLRLAYQYLIYTTIGVGVAILSFSAIAITRAILNI